MFQIAKYQGSRTHDALKDYVVTMLESAAKKDEPEEKTIDETKKDPEEDAQVGFEEVPAFNFGCSRHQ